jgi:hypothetical protein
VSIEIPKRLLGKPRTAGGLPIPYFVAHVEGRPDFRVADTRKFGEAVKKRLCWICGDPLGRMMCFVVGPMGTVNKISSEPPSHFLCAQYALIRCPFLSRPTMVRREAGMPEGWKPAPGVMLEHNPGVSALWTTLSFKLQQVHNGVLFEMGPPVTVSWWREGRLATRDEAMEGLRAGTPKLMEMAETEGPESVADIQQALQDVLRHLPA